MCAVSMEVVPGSPLGRDSGLERRGKQDSGHGELGGCLYDDLMSGVCTTCRPHDIHSTMTLPTSLVHCDCN